MLLCVPRSLLARPSPVRRFETSAAPGPAPGAPPVPSSNLVPEAQGFSEITFIPKAHLLAKPEPLPTSDPASGWTKASVRCGLLGIKLGMLSEFDPVTRLTIPVTAVHFPGMYVTQVKKPDSSGYAAVQIGTGDRKLKNTPAALLGHFDRSGAPPRARLAEFRVTPDAMLPIGMQLSVRHLVPGQFVDVQSRSAGKGFQGVMKRWGFGGQPASHGVSLTHRSGGSTGCRQDPGRVFRGKKMPGQMGNALRTTRNLQVVQVDTEHQVAYIKGAVPGRAGTWVRLRDATWKPWTVVPPFPTYAQLPSEPVGESAIVYKPPGWVTPALYEAMRSWVPEVGMDAKEKRQALLNKQKLDKAKLKRK